VEAELSARLEDLNAALDQRGTSLEQYASARGERPEALVAELRRRVVEDVRVDLALRALASAEGIEASDDDVRAELAQSAERAGVSVDELVERLGRAGRLPAVRSEVRKRKALRWLLEHVTVVDEEGRPVDRSLLEPPEQVSPSGAGDDAGHEEASQEGRRGVEVGAKEAVGGR
jgi:trigger factor